MKERLTFGMLGQVFIFSVWQFYCPRRPVPFSNRVCGARNTLAFIAAGRRTGADYQKLCKIYSNADGLNCSGIYGLT